MIATPAQTAVIERPSKAELDAFQDAADSLVDCYFHMGHQGQFERRQAAMLSKKVLGMAEKQFGKGVIPLFEIVEITRRAAIAYGWMTPGQPGFIKSAFDAIGPWDLMK